MIFEVGVSCRECEKIYWNKAPSDHCPVSSAHRTSLEVKIIGKKPWEKSSQIDENVKEKVSKNIQLKSNWWDN